MAESALLDPCEETRQGAIAALNKKYDSMITGGFVGDNQLFLVNANGRIYYICDAPVMYVYCPPQKFPFNLKNPAG